MGGIEGVGEAVTGGLIARAVEPEAGEALAGHAEVCLNCGTALVGAYCHSCGQAGHVHRTLTAFWHDIAHGVLHFEGKIWRILPLLAWRPGELTRRYVDGERARFVSPIALFLFSVFLMFATFSLLGGVFDTDGNLSTSAAVREMKAEQADRKGQLARLRAERARTVAAGRPTGPIDGRIRETGGEIAMVDAAARLADGGTVTTKVSGGGGDVIVAEGGMLNLITGWPPLDAAIAKANANPSLLIYKIQNNAYKFSWALIPLSVPFVWLLFLWRRGFRTYDHVVFVTYSIAFMTLLALTLSVAAAAGLPDGAVVLGLFLVPPLHMYRQLRGAYRLSRLSAAWRTIFLLFFSMIAATLFFTGLLAVGALG